MTMTVLYGLMIPFLGTSLGAACVFFVKSSMSDLMQRALTGFAAGVMVAASIWSLFNSGYRICVGIWENGLFSLAALGFWIGILFLLVLDKIIPHLHNKSNRAEKAGMKSNLSRDVMMVLAVTLHNIPEVMDRSCRWQKIRMVGYLLRSACIINRNYPIIISLRELLYPCRYAQRKQVKESIFLWYSIRSRRADRRVNYNLRCRSYNPGFAVSFEFCSRRYDLCCCRRAYFRNV